MLVGVLFDFLVARGVGIFTDVVYSSSSEISRTA